MSGGSGDDEKNKPTSFEEQVKQMRQSASLRQLQKTTEINVGQKLKRELNKNEPSLDQELVDQRLQATLNREAEQDFFKESLASVIGKKKPRKESVEAPKPEDNKAVLSDASSGRGQTRPLDVQKERSAELESLPAQSQAQASSTQNAVAVSGVSREFVVRPKQIRSFFDNEPAPPAVSKGSAGGFVQNAPSEPVVQEEEESVPDGIPGAEEYVLQETQQPQPVLQTEDSVPLGIPGADDYVAEELSWPAVSYEAENVHYGNSGADVSAPLDDTAYGAAEQYPDDYASQTYEEPGQEYYLSPEEIEANERRAGFFQYFAVESLKFKDETGLDMLLDLEDKIHIFLNAGGENQLLYEIECNDLGFAEARLFAESLCKEFSSRISLDFGVEFARPGQLAIRQLEPDEDNHLVPGQELFVRAGRLDELKALQRAIEFSWPATFQKQDELPMKVIFLDQPLIKDEHDGAVLKYLEDGRPVLFISPDLCRNGVPTEADPITNGNVESWQSAIMRELAWKSIIDCNKLPVDDATIQSLGWVLLKQENEETKLFGLKDAEGAIFMPYEDAASNEESWVRCNQHGEPVDENGNPVSEPIDMLFLSNQEMLKRAQTKPCGQRFFSPEEEIIDALRCFRQGPEWRMHLGSSNQFLYKLAKLIDQLDINRCYPSENGKDAYIRSSSGQVVENSSASQKDLVKFEQKLNRKQG